jgi:hypothetical protein
MTTTTVPTPPASETLGRQIVMPATRAPVASPIGWASIFAAAAVALGIWLLLHLLGVGIGLTTIDPDENNSLKAIGIGIGVWSLLAPIIALFLGGLVAGRTAPTFSTFNAIIHGVAAWAITAIASVLVIGMMLGATVRAASSTASGAAEIASRAGAQVSEGSPVGGLGMDAVTTRINQKLAERGMPPVQPEQLKAVLGEAAQRAARGETMDRQRLTEIVARNTALTGPQADQLAAEIEGELGNLGQQAQQTALQVAETTGAVILGFSITLALTLAASVIGAAIGVRRERREYIRQARGQRPVVQPEPAA